MKKLDLVTELSLQGVDVDSFEDTNKNVLYLFVNKKHHEQLAELCYKGLAELTYTSILGHTYTLSGQFTVVRGKHVLCTEYNIYMMFIILDVIYDDVGAKR